MSHSQKDYDTLFNLSKEIRTLQGISSLLDWDQETYMPPMGAQIRAEQLKTLAGVVHKAQVSRTFSSALAKLININTGKNVGKQLSKPQQAALREWRRDYLHAKALPKSFVEKFAKLTSQAMQVWQHAKHNNVFQPFSPFLEQIVKMSRQKADYLGYKKHPYDALLDLYEPDVTVAEIDPLFKSLRTAIVTLLKNKTPFQTVDNHFLFGDFSKEKQLKFCRRILDAMGYDSSKGRLDFSEHPFCSSCHPNDSRITINMNQKSLMNSISAVMHEAGHALYDMGLPVEQYGSPLGEPVSHAIHESQSRWWETRIGLSRGFWQHFFPILKEEFKSKLGKMTVDQFYLAINKVIPNLIRIQSDEVTYSLHIILRYELEKALIEGSLKIREVPEAWNAKMKELLGIAPKTFSEGCLQDVHWSMGGFGYFPSYTLGNLAAAQLFEVFESAHPSWEKQVAKGDLLFMKDWLKQNVYQYGRQYPTKDLLKKATGKAFSAEAYVSYLNKKYKKFEGKTGAK